MKTDMRISEIKIGQDVLIYRNVQRPFLAEVIHLTKTTITVDLHGEETAFSRIHGQEITDSKYYMMARIPTAAEIKKYSDLSNIDGE